MQAYRKRSKVNIDININTDKYYDLITLLSPPPLSLEENMSANSESRAVGKNWSIQSSSTESFTKRSFRLKPEHLAMHTSDSNMCNKQSAILSKTDNSSLMETLHTIKLIKDMSLRVDIGHLQEMIEQNEI